MMKRLTRRHRQPTLWVVLVFAGLLAWKLWPLVEIGHIRAGDSAGHLERLIFRFGWPEYDGRITFSEPKRLEPLEKAVDLKALAARYPPGPDASAPPYWLLDAVWSGGKQTTIAFHADLTLYGPVPRENDPIPTLKHVVEPMARELRRRFYGELVPWDEALRLFPVGETARLRDLETGASLEVRRHRGDAHADVEPVTEEDAHTLKAIYGGAWSWKRRAAVLTIGGRQVAASMNGMPHGWGDLTDNAFQGHFCVHFSGSRVHTTWRRDAGHQLMVLKAAGELAEAVDDAKPDRLAMWAIAAVNHRDAVSLRYMTHPEILDDQEVPAFDGLFSPLVRPIRHITPIGARTLRSGEKSAEVLADLLVYYFTPDPDEAHRKQVVIRLVRTDSRSPWRIVLSSLLPLARPGSVEKTATEIPAESC